MCIRDRYRDTRYGGNENIRTQSETYFADGVLQLANDGDYLELFAYLDTNGGSQGYISNDAQGYRGNFFSAFKLII